MLKGRVLLLNADYQVLGTIGVARAIRMTLRDVNPVTVPEYILNSDGTDFEYLTSGGGDKYPVPSIVVLKEFVNVKQKRQESGSKREKIYLRDKYQCQYCSAKVGKIHPLTKTVLLKKDLTLDHIVPKAHKGSGAPSNLVTACKKCNQRKADRTPEQAGMPLRTEIHDITDVGLDVLMICKYVENRPEWRPYLESQRGFKERLLELESGELV